MFKSFFSLLIFGFALLASVASAQQNPSTGYVPGGGITTTPTLGFGSSVTPTTTLPTGSGTPLSFGPGVPTGGDPTAYTGNPADYSLGTPVPGTGGTPAPGGAAPAESPPGAATAEEIQEAIANYVIPTNTRNFSLGNLNSQNEASLIISSGNEENNVIFRIIRLISMLVGTVAILLYIVAGYFMIFSQGDDNSLTKGKQILTFTSLGLVIVFGAYMIVQLVMGLIYFTS